MVINFGVFIIIVAEFVLNSFQKTRQEGKFVMKLYPLSTGYKYHLYSNQLHYLHYISKAKFEQDTAESMGGGACQWNTLLSMAVELRQSEKLHSRLASSHRSRGIFTRHLWQIVLRASVFPSNVLCSGDLQRRRRRRRQKGEHRSI